MKAAVLYTREKGLEIKEVPIPHIGPKDVLIKVRAAGICHTDLGIVDGHVPIGNLPMILGHEVSGEIAEIGGQVPVELKGKRVCVSLGIVCGSCAQCKAGNDTLCEKWQSMGRTVNGGFAEYMVAPAENVIMVPDHVSHEVAAIIPCSVATAYHTVKRGGVSSGQNVAIFGIGGLGLNAVQFANLTGANVIGVDVIDEKLKMAYASGAIYCINGKQKDPVEEIKFFTGGVGADVTLEFVGSPGTYQACINSVRRGGRVVIAGYHPEPLKVNSLRLMLDEVMITGAHVANRNDIKEIVSLLEMGKIDLKPMVTHTFDFANIHEGFETLRNQKGNPIRIVIKF